MSEALLWTVLALTILSVLLMLWLGLRKRTDADADADARQQALIAHHQALKLS